MKIIKKLISVFSAISIITVALISCDDANNTTEGYIEGLYTVWGKTVMPELEDTFYVTENVGTFGLKSGDRGVMRVKYFVDNVLGPKKAVWEIDEVRGLVETYPLTSATQLDSAEYSSPFVGITPFATYGSAWAWNKLQNLYAVYYTDGSDARFAMTPTGFAKDTLSLMLYADINDGETMQAQLLTFDLASALPLLDSKQQQDAMQPDTIVTKMSMLFYDAEVDSVIVSTIIGGRCANPFR